ncbi:MAG: hypothetical protein ABSE77_13685 [Acidimicrobiales bacterium]|jgi:hypothetical protein
MGPGTVADELYGLAPADFIAGRDARAAEARHSGDRELADAVKKLRRPSGGAWLANLLVRQRHEQVLDFLDLGAALRDAQARLAHDDLRKLSKAVFSAKPDAITTRCGIVGGDSMRSRTRPTTSPLCTTAPPPGRATGLRSGRPLGRREGLEEGGATVYGGPAQAAPYFAPQSGPDNCT